MATKYITTRAVNTECFVNGKSEMVLLRAGATLAYDEASKAYIVEKPQTADEAKIAVNDSTFLALKSIKSIVSTVATNALRAAKSGNNVNLERKIIDLVTSNGEKDEIIEELKLQVTRLTDTLANFTNAAATQQDDLEDSIPDYNAMNVQVLREICIENEIDPAGLKKDALVEALLELHAEVAE